MRLNLRKSVLVSLTAAAVVSTAACSQSSSTKESSTAASTTASTTAATTEAATEATTEGTTEAVTEAPTEEVTEAPTEEATEAPTEEVTEAPTEETDSEPSDIDYAQILLGTQWVGMDSGIPTGLAFGEEGLSLFAYDEEGDFNELIFDYSIEGDKLVMVNNDGAETEFTIAQWDDDSTVLLTDPSGEVTAYSWVEGGFEELQAAVDALAGEGESEGEGEGDATYYDLLDGINLVGEEDGVKVGLVFSGNEACFLFPDEEGNYAQAFFEYEVEGNVFTFTAEDGETKQFEIELSTDMSSLSSTDEDGSVVEYEKVDDVLEALGLN